MRGQSSISRSVATADPFPPTAALADDDEVEVVGGSIGACPDAPSWAAMVCRIEDECWRKEEAIAKAATSKERPW